MSSIGLWYHIKKNVSFLLTKCVITHFPIIFKELDHQWSITRFGGWVVGFLMPKRRLEQKSMFKKNRAPKELLKILQLNSLLKKGYVCENNGFWFFSCVFKDCLKSSVAGNNSNNCAGTLRVLERNRERWVAEIFPISLKEAEPFPVSYPCDFVSALKSISIGIHLRARWPDVQAFVFRDPANTALRVVIGNHHLWLKKIFFFLFLDQLN